MKTSELTGAALDWAVAKCEGLNIQFYNSWMKQSWKAKGYPDNAYCEHLPFQTYRGQWVDIETYEDCNQYDDKTLSQRPVPIKKYSTDWAQGGPIVAALIANRCKLYLDNNDWPCCYDSAMNKAYTGPTPLIAAMRCYVASKLGDEVEIPEELL